MRTGTSIEEPPPRAARCWLDLGIALTVPPSETLTGEFTGSTLQRLAAGPITRSIADFIAESECNSTLSVKPSERCFPQVERAFAAAREEDFQDGEEAEFHRELDRLVRRFEQDAISAIIQLVVTERAGDEQAAQALRCLGRIHHDGTYERRLWLLERCVRCSSAMVRDGAVLGLSSMGDPDAIRYLQSAIQRETCRELREDMQAAVCELVEQGSAAA